MQKFFIYTATLLIVFSAIINANGNTNLTVKINLFSVNTYDAVIKVEANQKVQAMLMFLEKGGYKKFSDKEKSFRYSTHKLHLLGLKPLTEYYCRAFVWNKKGVEAISNTITFKTKGRKLIPYYLPSNIEKNDFVRGVIEPDNVAIGGADPQWRAFAYRTKTILAPMAYTKEKPYQLKKMAEVTGHPEIEYTYWVAALSSSGARILNEATERSIAMLIHDSQWTAKTTKEALCSDKYPTGYFPVFSTAGSHDKNSIAVYDAAFIASQCGWPWTSSNDLSAKHCDKTVENNTLEIMWLEDVLKLRLPDTHSRNSFVPLRKIDITKGWLGKMQLSFKNNRNDFVDPEIYPYDKAPGNKKSYIWFPSERVAVAWYNLIRYGSPDGAREGRIILTQNLSDRNERTEIMTDYLDAVNTHGKVLKEVSGSKYFYVDKSGKLKGNAPPYGVHEFTLTMTDDFGSSIQKIRFRRADKRVKRPEVKIVSPKDGETFEETIPVTFICEAKDEITSSDSLLASAEWYSDIDGVLGRGGELTVDNLSPGMHVVSCTVFNSGGRIDVDTKYFYVEANGSNVAPIIAPLADAVINEDAGLYNLQLKFDDKNNDRFLVKLKSSNPNVVDDHGFYLYGSGYGRTLTILPRPNAYGKTEITVSVSDESLTTSETFTLTVNPTNDAPDLSNNVFELPLSDEIILDPLSNDIDVDGDSLMITGITKAESGTVEIIDNKIKYRPFNPKQKVADEFQIEVSDGNGNKAWKSIFIVADNSRLIDIPFENEGRTGNNCGLLGQSADARFVGKVKRVKGIIGKGAVKLAGNSNFSGGYWEIKENPGLNFNPQKDNFSISVWFKIEHHQGVILRKGKIIPKIFSDNVLDTHTSKRNDEGYNNFLGHAKDNPDFEIWVDKNLLHAKLGKDADTSMVIIKGVTKINSGDWHLATLVNNTGENRFELYLDDKLQGNRTSPMHTNTGGKLILGGFETEDSEAENKIMPYFTGEFDNFKIYKKALTPDEIKLLLKERK